MQLAAKDFISRVTRCPGLDQVSKPCPQHHDPQYTNAHMHEPIKPSLSVKELTIRGLPRKMQILEMEAARHTFDESHTFRRSCAISHDSSARTLSSQLASTALAI